MSIIKTESAEPDTSKDTSLGSPRESAARAERDELIHAPGIRKPLVFGFYTGNPHVARAYIESRDRDLKLDPVAIQELVGKLTMKTALDLFTRSSKTKSPGEIEAFFEQDLESLLPDPSTLKALNEVLCSIENDREIKLSLKLLDAANHHLLYAWHMWITNHHDTTICSIQSVLRELDGEQPLKGSRILELGAGPGTVTLELINKGLLAKDGDFTLVDIDTEALVIAERLLTEKGPLNQESLRTSAEIPEDAKGIDLIVSTMMFQWATEAGRTVEDKIAELAKRCFEIQTEGGRIVVVGETPPNVTATSPKAVLYETNSIGYDDGVSINVVLEKLLAAGYVFEAMSSTAIGINFDNPNLATPSLTIKEAGHHEMVCMVLRKPLDIAA